ncbi:MAG: hypothetical protein ABW360_14205 [Phenylobacterium sp.]
MRLGGGVLLICATVAGGTTAAPAGLSAGARAQVLQSLTDCRKLSDNAARLACYDTAAASLEQAEAKGDIVVVDREQARKVRRQAFGFALPSLALFEKGEKQEEIDNATGAVAAARQSASRRWVIRLEDGAVWTQVDATELFVDPKAGDPVRIRKAAMGSYLMVVGKNPAIRARREE